MGSQQCKVPLTEGSGSVEAEYEGSLRVPGVVIGAGGETPTPSPDGHILEVNGVLRLIDVDAEQYRISDMELMSMPAMTEGKSRQRLPENMLLWRRSAGPWAMPLRLKAG